MESASGPVNGPQVQIGGNAIQILMRVDGLQTMAGPQNVKLVTQDGKIEIKLAPEVFPFLQIGAVVPVTISLVQVLVGEQAPAGVAESNGLILPPGVVKPEGEPN